MQKLAVVFACLVASAFAVPLPDEESRIVGGSTAGNGQYPHQISMRQNNRHFCGGSIIDANWILTAAHCVQNQNSANILIVVGTNSLSSGGLAYRVTAIYAHEGYDSSNNQHDIALVLVSPSIQFNSLVQPIALASSAVSGNTPLTLSGWGLTQYPSNNLPDSLQHIGLTSISFQECQSMLPNFPVFSTHVCTTAPAGQGACQGDSGGPLISGSVQVGVVSWGIPCAKGSPDIFTSVAHYRSWIRTISGV